MVKDCFDKKCFDTKSENENIGQTLPPYECSVSTSKHISEQF